MKRNGNRLTALLLALCLVLGLAACGSKSNGDTNQLSGTVYVPEFMDLGLEVDYIDSGCCDGTNVYIVASVSSEEEVTDPETGETYTNYDYKTGLYRIPLDGSGGAVELENFKPAYEFEGDEGWYNLDKIRAGADGTIWVSEQASIYTYDLPEGFDENSGDKWQYQSSEEVQLQRQLDSTGTELQRIETGDVKALVGDGYINDTVIDDNGNIYVSFYDHEDNNEGVAVIKDGSILFTLEGDGWRLTRLGDGRVASRYYDMNLEEPRSVFRAIDLEEKAWGDEYPLPLNSNDIYDGAGDYLYYYDSGDSLYGFKKGANEGERLLSWSAADINVDDLVFFTFLDDGRVVAMTRSWRRGGSPKSEIAILTEQDASVLADKTILSYAGMYVSQDTRASIINFNKTSDKYRIEIRDYSEYNTQDDRQAGLTKLNTEILAGNIPDIIDTDDLPIRRYAAKGYLEDLWPMIDADPDISRDSLMENVFNAASIDGKLYQVFDSFGIVTVIGAKKVVGDRMSWTLKDLQDALATMPEGCAIFGETDTQPAMLSGLLSINLDSYVDWEKGESHFDSDSFKAVLQFCENFPAEFDYDNYNWEESDSEPVRIANGRQMLQTMYLSGFNDIQMYEAIFGGSDALYTVEDVDTSGGGSGGVMVATASSAFGASGPYEEPPRQRVKPGEYISYIGFPTEDGSVGSAFSIYSGMAISSTCKDKEGAWSFVRQLLLPEDDDEYGYRYWYFPSNKTDFDKTVERAMEKEYMTDAEGKNILDADGNPIERMKSGWTWDNLNIEILATTQQEYDQIMELYNAIDSVMDYDTSMFEIITEQAGPYFSGDKSLDEAVKLIQDRVNIYINENR